MIDLRLIYKIHKWLAVVVGLLTLGWFVSGGIMFLPERWLTLSPGLFPRGDTEALREGAPEFDQATLSPAAAIKAVTVRVGRPLRPTAIRLRRFPGRLAYEVTTERNGRHLVDAADGAIFTIDEELATAIVRRFLGAAGSLGPVTLQRNAEMSYMGALPAYRVPLATGKGTIFYVEQSSGNVHLMDPVSRVANVMMNVHRLWFLRSFMPDAAAVLIMVTLALLGTTMTASGLVILVAQFVRWTKIRRASPAA